MTDFLDWLAGLDSTDLAQVLGTRRDVLRGRAPDDLAAVASRLGHPSSVATSLVAQPKPSVQALTALVALGGNSPVTHLAALLEPGPGAERHVELVRHWCGVLAASALAWVDHDDVAHAAPGVDGVLALPEWLGAPAPVLLHDVSRERLRPTLQAWGLPADGSKAAMVASLTAAFGEPLALRERVGLLTDEQRATLLADVAEGKEREFDYTRLQQRALLLGEAVEAGIAAGVLLPRYSPTDFTMPAPARVALRGNGIPFDPHEPPLLTTPASPEMVERESRAALQQFAEASITVMDHVRDRPLKWVRNGGIGAREITRVAKACRVEVAMVRLVLDCAYAAGLFEWVDAGFACGQAAREWRDLDAGPRVLVLLQQWPFLGWMPTQTHDAAGKSLAVGDSDRECGRCTDARLATMAEWARVDEGRGASDDAMAELVTWVRPLDHFAHREYVVEEETFGYRRGRAGLTKKTYPEPLWLVDVDPTLGTIADEARMLGLIAHGSASLLLRAVLGEGGPEHLVAVAASHLPAASGEASFGSDLTAMVSGLPTGSLSTLLDSCADREGRGGAVTWRFSTASVRRALDAGVTAENLEGRLSAVARGPLPQPLTYLIADVGRRHGSLRVLTAGAVIRCEDVGLLAEVVADRKLRKLKLVQVAPTVAVAGVDATQALEALRKAGYLPMPGLEPVATESQEPSDNAPDGPGAPDAPGGPEGPDEPPAGRDALDDELAALVADTPVVLDLAAARARRSGASEQQPRPAPPPETPDDAAVRLAGVAHAGERAGRAPVDPQLFDALRSASRDLSDDELHMLADAILSGGPVRITYRSARGSVTDRVISQLELSGHMVEAWCHLRSDVRMFLVDEIQSVTGP